MNLCLQRITIKRQKVKVCRKDDKLVKPKFFNCFNPPNYLKQNYLSGFACITSVKFTYFHQFLILNLMCKEIPKIYRFLNAYFFKEKKIFCIFSDYNLYVLVTSDRDISSGLKSKYFTTQETRIRIRTTHG